MKSTFNTDYAVIELSVHNLKEPFKVGKVSEIPYGFFNMGNGKGERYTIALQIYPSAPVRSGYQYGEMAEILASTIESMRDTASDNLAARAVTEADKNLVRLNFDYQYPRNGYDEAKNSKFPTHAPKIEEILRGALNVEGSRFNRNDFINDGWSITRNSTVFHINSEHLRATFWFETNPPHERDANHGVAGKLDGRDGVLALYIPQLENLHHFSVMSRVAWEVDFELQPGFWQDTLTKLNDGITRFNKLPHVPEKLRVTELSSINHDRLTKSKANKGGEAKQIFEMHKLSDWFKGLGV